MSNKGIVSFSTIATTDAIIELNNISKIFTTMRGDSVVALSNASLAMRRGEFVTIVGPSGCGKSTLINIVSGLTQPTTGEVIIDGHRGPTQSISIGIVFQEPTLLLWRTVLQNVLLPVEIKKLPVSAYEKRARQLLEGLGLKGFEGAYPHELSGGMQQRAAIARALITDPAILLMDEPFSALDAFTRERLNVELLKLWHGSGKTILFVTHNIGEAVFLADRIIVMAPRPGRVVEDIEIIIAQPRNLDVMTSSAYISYVAKIRRLLQPTDET
jgi:NitT/TauT family transport system ATP-binding protein